MKDIFVILLSGGEEFALPADPVGAIFRVGSYVRVPLAWPGIAGLVDHRGTMITAVGLAHCLNGGAHRALEGSFAVTLTDGGQTVALIVDSVENVLKLDTSRRCAPPRAYEGARAGLVGHALMTADGALPVLDTAALFQSGTSPGVGAMAFVQDNGPTLPVGAET